MAALQPAVPQRCLQAGTAWVSKGSVLQADSGALLLGGGALKGVLGKGVSPRASRVLANSLSPNEQEPPPLWTPTRTSPEWDVGSLGRGRPDCSRGLGGEGRLAEPGPPFTAALSVLRRVAVEGLALQGSHSQPRLLFRGRLHLMVTQERPSFGSPFRMHWW